MIAPVIIAPSFGATDRLTKDVKEFENETIILVDHFDFSVLDNEKYKNKFFIQMEPFFIESIHHLISNQHRFDFIFGWREELRVCKNFIFFPFGTSWITEAGDYDRSEDFKIENKEFNLSFLCGNKNNDSAPGYPLRNKILDNPDKVKIPKNFYRNLPSKDIWRMEKDILYKNSMFSLSIENFPYKNYFSEKIVDCFITKTIPIYYGCPNIGDFFNINGILQFETIEEFYKIANNLNKEIFNNKIEIIEENYKKGVFYSHLLKPRFNDLLKDIGY